MMPINFLVGMVELYQGPIMNSNKIFGIAETPVRADKSAMGTLNRPLQRSTA